MHERSTWTSWLPTCDRLTLTLLQKIKDYMNVWNMSLGLTVIAAARLRVARLILHPLALAVLPSILGHRVAALPVGELHPSPARPGALLPRPPQAPATVHNHLHGGRGGGGEWGVGGAVSEGKVGESRAVGQSSVPEAAAAAQLNNRSLGLFSLCGRAARWHAAAKFVLKFGTRRHPPRAAFPPHVSLTASGSSPCGSSTGHRK